jgi:thiol-disulfide isomerase/thioredoxin
LINYWAEWCRPCIEEIPELNKLNEEMDIQVLGYDYDKQKGQALIDKVDRLGIEFPVVMNEPSQLFSQKLPAGLPATMLVDKRGEFVTWLIGPQTVESVKKALQ